MKTETQQTPKVKLSDIVVSKMNPRKIFAEDDLKQLTDSIRSEGLIQPILIRPKADKYELVCGERRFRAHLLLQKEDKKFDSIEVKIKELSDEDALGLMITENLQRVNVTVMEEAAGFKTLMEFKKYNPKEIALLVGKPETYVSQRLKMNDLSENYQKALHNERLKITDANWLCRLSLEDQQEIWKEEEHGANWNIMDPINLEYVIESWAGNLSEAPFDLKDPKLNEKMGACTVCPFNSQNTPTLFPELKKGEATCQKKSCFLIKCNAGFKVELAKALQNPSIVLFIAEYTNSSDLQKKYEKEGFRVITKYSSCNTVKGQKGAVYCFCMDGNDKGKYSYRLINNAQKADKTTSKTTKENIASGKASAQDIKNEIAGMLEREKRKKELDEIKIQEGIFEALGKHADAYQKNKAPLTLNEKRALAIVLLGESREHNCKHPAGKAIKKLSGISKDYGNNKAYKALEKLTPNQLNDLGNMLVRCMLLEKLQPVNESRIETSDYACALRGIAFEISEKDTKKVIDEQKAIADTRDERVKQRIIALKATPIEKPKAKGGTDKKKKKK